MIFLVASPAEAVARLAAMARRVMAVFFMSDAVGMMDDVIFLRVGADLNPSFQNC
jgi:hypothetical protein